MTYEEKKKALENWEEVRKEIEKLEVDGKPTEEEKTTFMEMVIGLPICLLFLTVIYTGIGATWDILVKMFEYSMTYLGTL